MEKPRKRDTDSIVLVIALIVLSFFFVMTESQFYMARFIPPDTTNTKTSKSLDVQTQQTTQGTVSADNQAVPTIK